MNQLTEIAREQDGPQPDHQRNDLLWSLLERNPWAGGNILRGEVPRVYVVTALPTATVERRSQILVLAGDTAEADVPYICIKNDSDTYEWLSLGGFEAQANTTDIKDTLVNIGALTDGGATPLDLDGGVATLGNASVVEGDLTVNDELTVSGPFTHGGSTFGVFATTPTTKKTVTGSRGANAALASLITQLASYGLITDGSSA